MFNVLIQNKCCSTRLSWAQVPVFTGSSVRERKKKGGGKKWETTCTDGYKKVQAVRLWSVAGVKVLWNLECPKIHVCAHFNEGNWAQFGWSAKR